MERTEHSNALLSSEKQASDLILLWVHDAAAGLASFIEPLVKQRAKTPLVVISPTIERWDVRSALAAGASRVALLGDLDAGCAMPGGRPYRSGVRAACALRQIEPPALSSREKQILGLVVMGFSNGQIAQQLFLAESTVKSHLSSAFGKLGVRSRNEAASLIIDPERGLGMGILSIVREGESHDPTSTAAQ